MRFLIVLALLAGCAHAGVPKPKPKPHTATTVKRVKPLPPVPEKPVSEAELLRYKAAYLNFKSLEVEILQTYKINAEIGETFDPDTGTIARVKSRTEKKR